MRNMRGALGALFVAGAAYAWKHRGRLSQQLGALRQPGSLPQRTSRTYELPDLSPTEQRDFSTRPFEGANDREREFGGTSL